MHHASESDLRLVKSSMLGLVLPEKGSVWVGPYEQLHGAGYALLGAARHNVYGRDFSDYHLKVRAKVVQLILEHADKGAASDKDAFDNAIAGFYFNSAIQRIVWASERLVKTFISVKCKCCGKVETSAANDSSRFSDFLKDAKGRVKHLDSNAGLRLVATPTFLALFTRKTYKREGPYCPQNSLSMLRYDVNNRKHSLYGPLARDRRSASQTNHSRPKKWSDAPQDVQMHVACEAFRAVCDAYNELRNWQPNYQA